MNKERDFYYTLELQPGASPSEIKTAFRRLVKLYHPDHDQSLDAEMRYKEIRVAYKMLLDRKIPSGASATTDPDVNRYASPKQATRTPEDWATEYKSEYKKIPLEWKNLPSIFINSIKEISIGVFFIAIC